MTLLVVKTRKTQLFDANLLVFLGKTGPFTLDVDDT
jgi:hypothetical protein